MSDHETNNNYGNGNKTLTSYMIGLALAFILTCAAFSIVDFKFFSVELAAWILMALAVVQLFVHSMCFLRLNFSPEGRWNLLPFLCVILIIVVLVGGSAWIMAHLNYNMTH